MEKDSVSATQKTSVGHQIGELCIYSSSKSLFCYYLLSFGS